MLVGNKELKPEFEDERAFNISVPYPYLVTKTVTLKLPDGYRVSNPESLNKHIENEAGSFTSEAVFINNTFTLTLSQVINEGYYPKEMWDEYTSLLKLFAEISSYNILIESEK